MNAVKDKIWFLREGLFAKYVISLVGLVVFVLAVNGAMETWISYRATRTTLTNGMREKAEATAKRIEQSMAEMERQINWVTRASASRVDLAQEVEQHRADYAQLLNQVPSVNQLSFVSGKGREQLRLSRLSINYGSNVDFSGDTRFSETLSRGTSFAPVYFRDQRPYLSIALSHSGGYNAGVTLAEIDLRFLNDYLSDAQVGRSGFAYVVDEHGQVLASSTKGPDIAKDLSALPQVAAALATNGATEESSGTDTSGHAVLTASSAINNATRTSWSRIGESACAVGCSKNTNQPSLGTGFDAVSTAWPSASVPDASSWRPGFRIAATCGSVERSLATSGPLAELASTRPFRSIR